MTSASAVANDNNNNNNNSNNGRLADKADEIRRLLSEPVVDLWKLRDHAISEGGLVNDSLRKLAWPKLVGVDQYALAAAGAGAGANNGGGRGGKRAAVVGGGGSTGDAMMVAAVGSGPEGDDDNDDDDDDSTTDPAIRSLDHQQIQRDVSRVTWHLLSGSQRSRNFQMRNKQRTRIRRLLTRKQRRLGDFLNLTLALSYRKHGGGGDDDDDGDDDDADARGVDDGDGAEGGSVWEGDDDDDDGLPVKIGGSVGDDDDKGDGDDNRLRYYQGYHDVGSIVLSALGGASSSPASSTRGGMEDEATVPASSSADDPLLSRASSTGLYLASRVLLRLSRSHLRDALRPDFLRLQAALKLVIMPLVAAFDGRLHSHLHDCQMEPYFCLSWIITWFAHDVRDTALVKRLYDFFVSGHPMTVVYVSVAMMMHPLNRIEVLGADCDFACVHHALADLPKNSSDAGWKYVPGDKDGGCGGGGGGSYSSAGYGGTENDDDDDFSCDASLQDDSIDTEDDGSILSAGGRRGGATRPRVPFQELIDLALSLMHKIPPRNLVNLARRYHAQVARSPLPVQSSTIALLQPPPSWGLAPRADSDWVLRQRAREERGLGMNRHQRKNRRRQQGGCGSGGKGGERDAPPPLPGDEPSMRAVIASGTGPDGLAAERQTRRRRRMMMRSVAVVVLAVLVALAKRISPPSSRQLSPTHSLQEQRKITKDALMENSVAKLVSSTDDTGGVSRTAVASDTIDNCRDGEPSSGEGDDQVTEAQEAVAIASLVSPGNEKSVAPQNAAEEEKPGDDKCHEDQHILELVAEPDKVEQHSVVSEATLRALVMSSVLFMKKLMTIYQQSSNQTLYLHLDQMEQQFDYVMMQFMELAKAGWYRVAPLMMNALRVGWRQMKLGWLKIEPALRKEISSEVEGERSEWAEDAMKTWKNQEKLLRNQGRLIHSFVVLDVMKLAKTGQESLAKKKK